MNQLDFKGKTAVVTGGMQGIGAAIVKRLEASGAKVAIWDLDGPGKVDVANNDSILGALKSTLAQLGRIDVLVNNAGIAGPSMPVVDYPIDQWERVINIDLNGPFLCCRAVVPHMVKAGYGRIVNIASTTGAVSAVAGDTAYAAAKAGMVGFTRATALEAAPFGITINAVAPGWIATGSQTKREAAAGLRTPVRRSGTPAVPRAWGSRRSGSWRPPSSRGRCSDPARAGRAVSRSRSASVCWGPSWPVRWSRTAPG